ncbi:hypothetical protein A0H81_07762 [Grifola frondosa]|uniref:Secreted protein n=1 Tax=Grifola frondosa TaxID=5627 RepID=A0A1C7M4Z4_GRIFR|nr:hypothetical protein A0H81_07762 [Grifola frondosa]
MPSSHTRRRLLLLLSLAFAACTVVGTSVAGGAEKVPLVVSSWRRRSRPSCGRSLRGCFRLVLAGTPCLGHFTLAPSRTLSSHSSRANQP